MRESAGRDMRPNDRAATSWLHPAPGPEGRSGAGETRKLNSTDTFCRALWTPGSEKQRLAGLLDDDCCLLPAACLQVHGNVDHLSLSNTSPRSRHTFQLHLVEDNPSTARWRTSNWQQYDPFPRLGRCQHAELAVQVQVIA